MRGFASTFALVLSLVGGALAGCIGSDIELPALPSPRVGDQVSYYVLTQSGTSAAKGHWRNFTIVASEPVRDGWGVMRPSFGVEFEIRDEYRKSLRYRVDAGLNALIRTESVTCWSMEAQCRWDEEVSFQAMGLPWGYGASLFHHPFAPLGAMRRVVNDALPVDVVLHATEHETIGPYETTKVEIVPSESWDTWDWGPTDGTVWLDPTIPYVVKGEFANEDPQSGVRVELRDFRPGAGPAVLRPPLAPAFPTISFVPLDGSTPPGYADDVAVANVTFPEMLQEASKRDGSVSSLMSRAGWYVQLQDLSYGGGHWFDPGRPVGQRPVHDEGTNVRSSIVVASEATLIRAEIEKRMERRETVLVGAVEETSYHSLPPGGPDLARVARERVAQPVVSLPAFFQRAAAFLPGSDVPLRAFYAVELRTNDLASPATYEYFWWGSGRLTVDARGYVVSFMDEEGAAGSFDVSWTSLVPPPSSP